MQRLDVNSELCKDFDSKFGGLSTALLLDIFDVHKCYLFSNHFQSYNSNDFKTDIIKNGTQYLGTDFMNKYIKYFPYQFGNTFYSISAQKNKLFNNYLINDDLMIVFRYHFAISNIVYQIQSKCIHLCVSAFVIPKFLS